METLAAVRSRVVTYIKPYITEKNGYRLLVAQSLLIASLGVALIVVGALYSSRPLLTRLAGELPGEGAVILGALLLFSGTDKSLLKAMYTQSCWFVRHCRRCCRP